jgi:predicted nucleotide-binding protein
MQAPPHLGLECWLISQNSTAHYAGELAKQARYIARYLEKSMKMKGRTVAKLDGPIFIGHGHSVLWHNLRDFIRDRLQLPWEEFNREPQAGRTNKERLTELLDRCPFAFLIMTAEDEQKDGKHHARMNVIHEAGLFQGRYGFERAIILLEDGCEQFSNLYGVGHIPFPKGDIKPSYEEIRRVLERERIL